MPLTRESYGEFGFDIDLVFRHEFPDFEPCGISLAKPTKLTTLSEGTVVKLKLRVDGIKDHLRRFTQEGRMDEEGNLVRCLSKRKDIHSGHSDPIAVSMTIYQQRKGCRDVVNLCDFEMYSCMIVLRATNRPGYEVLKQKIAEEKEITYLDELRDVYHCVHCILDRLDLAWHGLHLLLGLFLHAQAYHSNATAFGALQVARQKATQTIETRKLMKASTRTPIFYHRLETWIQVPNVPWDGGGKYDLYGGLIGSGKYSTVRKARWVSDSKTVAGKIIGDGRAAAQRRSPLEKQ
ncbi:hypothetical protein LTR12_017842 [Friedmanniomyces endolithicus]|nr:hypothetical protein LTR12_017842 [Friedmanniomyces endolithicus]